MTHLKYNPRADAVLLAVSIRSMRTFFPDATDAQIIDYALLVDSLERAEANLKRMPRPVDSQILDLPTPEPQPVPPPMFGPLILDVVWQCIQKDFPSETFTGVQLAKRLGVSSARVGGPLKGLRSRRMIVSVGRSKDINTWQVRTAVDATPKIAPRKKKAV